MLQDVFEAKGPDAPALILKLVREIAQLRRASAAVERLHLARERWESEVDRQAIEDEFRHRKDASWQEALRKGFQAFYPKKDAGVSKRAEGAPPPSDGAAAVKGEAAPGGKNETPPAAVRKERRGAKAEEIVPDRSRSCRKKTEPAVDPENTAQENEVQAPPTPTAFRPPAQGCEEQSGLGAIESSAQPRRECGEPGDGDATVAA
jgi:hypothetical protein